MRWLHFILSHSIFVSLCAVALCYQTFTLLHIQPGWLLYAFVFFSTLSSYNFYWFLSKYSFGIRAGFLSFLIKNRNYVFIFCGAGSGMLICLYYIPNIQQHVAIAVLLTLLYSMPLWPFKWAKYLRRVGVLKTILLAFTWAYVTVIIPAATVLHTQTFAVISLMIARFFFVGMLCVIFDTRDIKLDKLYALRSLATDVSTVTLKNIMLLSFIIYVAAGLLVRYHFSDNFQLFAFIITGLVTGWVYLLSFKPRGYLFYYFGVDGLMLFSAGATFVASLF